MATNIEKIKERVDIVELISSYLKLQKSGVNYKANCPFHGEKTPSFYVSPERQIWHCFGCGLGGSIFDFVMHIDGLEFGEAMRLLARRAGVELEQFDQTVQSEKGRLLEVVDWASKFFQKQLWESNAGLKALAYLKERGLSEPSIKQWQLGFAPESWDSLGNFLQAKRYRASEIFNSGLSVKRERGDGYYDRFRSRIVFPKCRCISAKKTSSTWKMCLDLKYWTKTGKLRLKGARTGPMRRPISALGRTMSGTGTPSTLTRHKLWSTTKVEYCMVSTRPRSGCAVPINVWWWRAIWMWSCRTKPEQPRRWLLLVPL